MTLTWLIGLLRRRRGRLLAVAAGITVAVALLAALGGFLVAAQHTMTGRATRSVAVDWQVQVTNPADRAAVQATVQHAAGTTGAAPVSSVTLPGLAATTGGTQQTTGQAVALGLPAGYQSQFPGQIRTLAGNASAGALIAQQTAANLHVRPGDTITVERGPGLPPATVTVGAIVDLPQANSLFQRVGAAPQAQPIAPPDNVIVLPQAQFDALTPAPLAGTVTWQIHAARAHDLPATPAAAYVAETGAARNLEVALAGGGLVGDNLGAALGAARSDAAYAQILFLFLGAPGALLAGLLTATVAAAGADRRRRDQALLRTRGADAGQIATVTAAEAVVVSVAGATVGLAVAAVLVWADPTAAGLAAGLYVPWFAAAATVGIGIGLGSVLVPVRRDLRGATVVAARTTGADPGRPWFLRYYLDVVLLAGSAAVFAAAAQSKYSLVLAPEGVPTIKVSYWALAAPVLLWIGRGAADLAADRPAAAPRPTPPDRRRPPAGRAARQHGNRRPEPAAPQRRLGGRAAGPGDFLRRLHRHLQHHLPSPGRS